MDDYQKILTRSMSLDHAQYLNKGKKAPLKKVLKDAVEIHAYLTDAPRAPVLKLAKGENHGN